MCTVGENCCCIPCCNEGYGNKGFRNHPTCLPPKPIPACCAPVPCSSCCSNACVPFCVPQPKAEQTCAKCTCWRPKLRMRCPCDLRCCPIPCGASPCCSPSGIPKMIHPCYLPPVPPALCVPCPVPRRTCIRPVGGQTRIFL